MPGVCFRPGFSFARVQAWLGLYRGLKFKKCGLFWWYPHSSCYMLSVFWCIRWHKWNFIVYSREIAVCEGNVSFNKLPIWGTWNICSNAVFIAQNFSFYYLIGFSMLNERVLSIWESVCQSLLLAGQQKQDSQFSKTQGLLSAQYSCAFPS